MSRRGPFAAWLGNPFYVLGLGTAASRVEVERTGQKLLGLLAIGSDAARTYDTPLGPAMRDVDGVRKALELLRDPQERVIQELLADLGASVAAPPGLSAADGWTPDADIPGWTPE